MKVYYEYEIHSTYAAKLEIDNDLILAIKRATDLNVTEEQIKDIISKEPHDRTLIEIDILNAIQDYMCDEVGFDIIDEYEAAIDSWEVEED